MGERMRGTDDPGHQERRLLILEALQEDHERTVERLVRERERQRTAEADKSTRLTRAAA